MPLPQLPEHYQAIAKKQIISTLPRNWFHGIERGDSPLLPLLDGLALALAHVRYSTEQARDASIPMRSEGVWLTLHLLGIGQERALSDSVDYSRDVYRWQFKPSRNTRDGQLAALERFLGLTPPEIRLEMDRALGRLGEFRLVVDTQRHWETFDFRFVEPFINDYVSNGIIPSLDLSLQCLLYQGLPAYQFSTQFPMGFEQLGPIWERPAFVQPIRLSFARSLFAQVKASEWRLERDRLLALLDAGASTAPAAAFIYLSDRNPCPYLLADYTLAFEEDPESLFPSRPFGIDGYKFSDQFPIIGPSSAASITAPQIVADLPLLTAPDLVIAIEDLSSINDMTALSSGAIVLKYFGLDFTRLQITEFYDPLPSSPSTDPAVGLMIQGPWTLAITEGNPDWGNVPPAGTTLFAAPFVELSPESLWWTDEQGDVRSSFPIWNGEALYLAMEFLYPKSATIRTIKELELRLNDSRVHYRRLSFRVDERINAGFIFKVRASR